MLSLVWPVASLGVILAMAQEAMTAAARILEIFDTEPDIVTGTRVIERPRGPAAVRARRLRVPRLATSRCCAASTSSSQPGETVALVGATGSGKTILTALVPRLFDVTGGRVPIDGVDVRDLDLAPPALAGRDRVRGPHAVLDERPGEPHARPRPRDRPGHRRGDRPGARASPRPSSSTTCRGGSTPGSASRVWRSPAASGSGSRSPARSSPSPRSWSSTTPCRRSTSTPRSWSRRR